ncbi:hypothetical protein ACHHYP_04873 [Achlya hypogyna]|uniref:WW domain-containing protein n=1 Tax=Achlya hypogyna TaxID=1202772 RepID=A0A1V9ZNZ0_ACHHY|nr:hypothetical protein ACHHYP_04873 [Achlya hypogyna]
MAGVSDRFVKCPSCHVNIPKADLALDEGRAPTCTLCHKPLPAALFADAALAPAPAKTATQRRWVELKSRRGKTYYHNNETGEDRWDKPADLDVTVSVPEAAPSFMPFQDDPVKKAILLQQTKQDAKKQGIPDSVVDAMAKQQAAAEPSSIDGAIAALKKAQGSAHGSEPAMIPAPVKSPKKTAPSPAPAQEIDEVPSSSCGMM